MIHSMKANKLTNREAQILKLIADGLTNREIADLFEVSIRTIETHRGRLMLKLSIYTVPGLVKYAIRQGISNIDQQSASQQSANQPELNR